MSNTARILLLALIVIVVIVLILILRRCCDDPSPQPGPPVDVPDTVALTGEISEAPDAPQHALSVARFEDDDTPADDPTYAGEVKLTNAEVDSTFTLMAELLEKDHDGPTQTQDVECVVRFERSEDVATFDHPSGGYIYTHKDFNEIMALPGCVKMVKGIYYCAGKRKDKTCPLSTTAWGCAQIPTAVMLGSGTVLLGGRKFAVRREEIVASAWAMLWAHEFGHTQGLTHDTSSDRLMHKSLNGFSVYVSQAQANRFRTVRPDDACEKTDEEADGSDTPTACSSAGGG